MDFNALRYQDARTGTYLGSPSLVSLPDGTLVAIHDYFGPGAPSRLGVRDSYHLISVYRSEDGGETWRNVTHITGAFWTSVHVIGDALYTLGASHQYGHIVIRRSTDGGRTWTHPVDERSGILFRAGPGAEAPNYHCAPVPLAVHQGRVYRAFEDNDPLDWPTGFRACVISADVDSDLLNAASWTMSEKLPFDPAWLPPTWGHFDKAGWLEGNVVVDRAGQLWNVLRLNAFDEGGDGRMLWNKAALVHLGEDGHHLTFDPATGFIEMPGGHTKFTIRYDPDLDGYLTLSNGVEDPEQPTNRAVLSLYISFDLRHWRHVARLLEDDQGLTTAASAQQTGFQYVDWHFDGDDLIYLVRTAYDGAHNFHDANRITFHRLSGYRRLCQT
jgi:hypothetical protein